MPCGSVGSAPPCARIVGSAASTVWAMLVSGWPIPNGMSWSRSNEKSTVPSSSSGTPLLNSTKSGWNVLTKAAPSPGMPLQVWPCWNLQMYWPLLL